jgi:hypothetical protein
MDERTARLEATVTLLASKIADLEARLATLETSAPSDREQSQPEGEDLDTLQTVDVPRVLGLIGRTLLVLGGAYLLRALTDAGVLPTPVGVGLGLLYSAPWLLLATRAAGRGANLDALCHGISTVLIVYPLVWEATVRFRVLTPPQSAALLVVLTAIALVVSAAHRLQSLAWVVTLSALASAFSLAIATGDWISYTVLAIAVGIGTLWLGYLCEWTLLRWPAALVANFMILATTGRAGDSAGVVVFVQFLMLTAYLGSFTLRTLAIGREVIPFEVVQSAAVLGCAYGGALSLLYSTDASVVPVGIVSLLLGAIGYALAFTWVEQHRHVKNFFYCSALALVFTLAGFAVCFGTAGAPLTYAAMALAASVLARRHRRLTLVLHSAIFLLAAAAVSGLLTTATLAMTVPPSAGWGPPAAPALFTLLAIALVVAMPVAHSVQSWGPFASLLRCVLVSLLVWTSVGTAVAVCAPVLIGRSTDAAVLSGLRTAVLVAAAIIVARAGRTAGGREAGWLMYPILALTGLKLLVADVPQGRPATLFVALALYGFVLIVGPRLARQRTTAPAPDGIPKEAVERRL